MSVAHYHRTWSGARTRPCDSLAGMIFNGRYRVLRHLGSGGSSRVFLANDVLNHRQPVAVKLLFDFPRDPLRRTQEQQRFSREAHVLATLHHPQIPTLREACLGSRYWYLAMQFIEGVTLEKQILCATTPFTERQVLHIGLQMCAVLHFLHQGNLPIVFRDLKPANIMCQQDGRLVLIDFGLACSCPVNGTVEVSAMGTKGYAAPEQYGDDYGYCRVSPRADIYSLGVILHQMLSGVDPRARSLIEMFRFAPLSVRSPLASLVMQMIAPDPLSRPQCIEEVESQLRRCAAVC